MAVIPTNAGHYTFSFGQGMYQVLVASRVDLIRRINAVVLALKLSNGVGVPSNA